MLFVYHFSYMDLHDLHTYAPCHFGYHPQVINIYQLDVHIQHVHILDKRVVPKHKYYSRVLHNDYI